MSDKRKLRWWERTLVWFINKFFPVEGLHPNQVRIEAIGSLLDGLKTLPGENDYDLFSSKLQTLKRQQLERAAEAWAMPKAENTRLSDQEKQIAGWFKNWRYELVLCEYKVLIATSKGVEQLTLRNHAIEVLFSCLVAPSADVAPTEQLLKALLLQKILDAWERHPELTELEKKFFEESPPKTLSLQPEPISISDWVEERKTKCNRMIVSLLRKKIELSEELLDYEKHEWDLRFNPEECTDSTL